jgi:FkbM family methyltransferase
MNQPSAGSLQTTLANVRASLRFYRENRRYASPPAVRSMGFRFMGSQAMESGQFEPEETAIFKRIIAGCDLLINVGANVGYYCCLGLQAGKHVVAYEPLPGNQRALYTNIWANQWQEQIEVFPVALADKPQILKLFGAGTGASLIDGWAGADSTHFTLVPATTLDLSIQERFRDRRVFLLVDVEGAEYSMLQGATKMLAREPKPVWMVEIAVNEHQPKGIAVNPQLLQTFDLFWQAGYRAWTAQASPRLVKREEVAAIAASGKDTLGTHNFIFASSNPLA